MSRSANAGRRVKRGVEGGLQGLLVSVVPAQRTGARLLRTPHARSVPAGNRGMSRQTLPNFAAEVPLPPIYLDRTASLSLRRGGYRSRSLGPEEAYPPDCAQHSGHLGGKRLGGWKIKKTRVSSSKARSSDGRRPTHGSVANFCGRLVTGEGRENNKNSLYRVTEFPLRHS